MKKSQKQGLAVAGGVAALAAAATAVYFMTGKNAKNRKKVAKWANDMRNDVVKELGKASKVSQATYNKAVDTVTKNYKTLKKINTAEVALAASELKKSWDAISSEMEAAVKTVRHIAPKSVKSIAKKVKVRKLVGKVTKLVNPAKKKKASKKRR